MHAAPFVATALLIAPGAWAQSTDILLRVGDTIPNAGKVTDIESVHVSYLGKWSAVVHTDDPIAHTVVVATGDPVIFTGQSLPSLGGAAVAGARSATWDLFDLTTWIADVSGAPYAQAVMYANSKQFESGSSTDNYAITDYPSGSIWGRFDQVQFADAWGGYLLRGTIDDVLGQVSDLSTAAVVLHGGSLGAIVGLEVLALEGRLAPGLARSIETVPDAVGSAHIDRDGARALWSCDLDGSASDDGCVYSTVVYPNVAHTLLAREGSPSPVVGRTWGPLEDIGLFAGPTGGWTLRGALDPSDPSDDEVLVRDGAVLAREGHVHPAIAPHTVDSLGDGRAWLDAAGGVLWFARWDDPATPGVDEALVYDDAPVVRTGVTTVAGSLLTDIESEVGSYRSSAVDGRFVVFVGSLADGTRALMRSSRTPLGPYCTGKLHSGGCTPTVNWYGALPSANSNTFFWVRWLELLPQQPAFVFYGTQGKASIPFHGSSLCVQPPLRRMPATSTTAGPQPCSGLLQVDFNAWIASGADPSLVAGTHVYTQAWFRDPGLPPPDEFGLTNAFEFVIGP